MALNWNSVTAAHVTQACEKLRDTQVPARQKARGIFVFHEGQYLPAKQVIRVAYLLANNMPLETKLKFASGESTVNRLRGLGFQVERQDVPNPVIERKNIK